MLDNTHCDKYFSRHLPQVRVENGGKLCVDTTLKAIPDETVNIFECYCQEKQTNKQTHWT